jgi:pimeloyl-ACP methyl ester carboxylesterase
MLALATAVAGVLVTTQGGTEIGRETFRDDGKTLRSEIAVGGQSITITLTREPRKAVVEIGGKTITREVPPGTLALENGHWQAYALAAEQYPQAREPVAVKVLLPASGMVIDGKIRVTARPDRSRRVELAMGPLAIEVDVGPDGAVTHAAIPLQAVEVHPAGAGDAPRAPVADAPRAAPAGVVEEPVEIDNHGVKVRGVLWRPAKPPGKGKPPLALVIAGSGPTDRDGNNRMGLQTDSYRMLAEGLARAGVASIRYDKRGIGASDKIDERTGVVGDLVGDAAALVAFARKGGRFSKVTAVGHSEGGLIALLLAQKAPLDGVVLLAATGRPLWEVVHEQVAGQIHGEALARVDRVLAALRDGQPVKEYPQEQAALVRPSVEGYLRSEIALDPAELLGKLKLPVAIVQGETDIQVSVADARLLAAARPDARLSLLPRVNHALKEEAARSLAQPSYHDPTRPLGPGVLDAVLAGVAR